MSDRNKLQEELLRFSKYIEEWFPRIQKITVFGSYLWDENPGDIDVWVEGNTRLLGDSHKALFPSIHVTKYTPKQIDLVVKKTVWNRNDGIVSPVIPLPSRKDRQFLFLKRQLAEVRQELRSVKSSSHSHTSYGYFGDY